MKEDIKEDKSEENVTCFIDDKKVDCSLLKDDRELYDQIPDRY